MKIVQSDYKDKKGVLAATQRGDWNKATAEMLDSRWAKQVGRRAQELAEIMKTGAYNELDY